MKTLIAYHSKTGNTKKIAEAIRDALGGNSVTLLPVQEAQDTQG